MWLSEEEYSRQREQPVQRPRGRSILGMITGEQEGHVTEVRRAKGQMTGDEDKEGTYGACKPRRGYGGGRGGGNGGTEEF